MRDRVAQLMHRYLERTERSRERLAEASLEILRTGQPAGEVAAVLPPILLARAEGARVWDVDDNEYVDVTMGFGVHFLGHGSPLVRAAFESAMAQGVGAGLVTPSYLEAVARLRRATGLPVIHLGTTGTEAVMTAIRAARTRTGRRLVARFSGHYHGHADVVLGSQEDSIVLPPDRPETIEQLRHRSSELAAVVVSPVSALDPGRSSRSFLGELQAVCRESGAAFVLDEVLTGFRFGPQPLCRTLGLEPDLLVLGKVIGGGHPIGAIATTEQWLGQGADAMGTRVVFPRCVVAGTYNRSALATTTCEAVLGAIERGEVDYAGTERRSEAFAATLERIVEQRRLGRVSARGPLVTVCFDDPRVAAIAALHLAVEGVYTRAVNGSAMVLFLSSAHSEIDLRRVLDAMQTAPTPHEELAA